MTFYIVRHGQTLLNRLDRAQGWCDSPLTPDGVRSAAELGERLRGVRFDAAYASDTRRAVATAEGILSASGNGPQPVTADPRLREWCLGSMEAEKNQVFLENVSRWLGGVTGFAEMNRRLPEVAEAIRAHDTTGMTEPFSAITARLQGFLVEAAERAGKDSRVLVVTHAFAIKTILYLIAPGGLERLTRLKNGSVFRVGWDSGRFWLEGEGESIEMQRFLQGGER